MLSDTTREWLNIHFGHKTPYYMNSENLWELLKMAKHGDLQATEVWNDYRHKVKLPEATKIRFKTFDEFVLHIYG